MNVKEKFSETFNKKFLKIWASDLVKAELYMSYLEKIESFVAV